MKSTNITMVLALAAFSLPALAEAPAGPAVAPAASVAAPATEGAMHLPAESAGEAQLRAQLEQVRALNAQLRQERAQLEAQLAAIQAEVVVEDKRLKQVVAESERMRDSAASGFSGWLLAGAMLGIAALLGVGFWYLHRRRNAVGKA